jgi:hypothetical protein
MTAMFDRFARSWELVKASADVLRQDRELMLFPLISSVAAALVLVTFLVPVAALSSLSQHMGHGAMSLAFYLVLFLAYFVLYFVTFYFNAALVGAAMMRLDGGDPTFADGMRIARSRIGAIAGYALIAASVGVVLRILEERLGFIGRMVTAALGVGWSLATYLVVPVLVTRDVPAMDAVKESAALFRKTWGENVVGQAGMGAAFTVIMVVVAGAAYVAFSAAAATGNAAFAGLVMAAGIFAVAVTVLVQGALSGIYEAALYRYATSGEIAPGFDTSTLRLAFAPK